MKRVALLWLTLCCSGSLGAQTPEDFGITSATPPTLDTEPDLRYVPRLRMWQGIPSIERTRGGRLWATWYCGPLMEGAPGNYAVLVTSENGGRTWSPPVAVYDASLFFDGQTGDPHVWIDPRGRMWWFVNRILKVKDPNGIRSLWGFCTDDPESARPKWRAPVIAGYGVGLNKPTVLSNGDWLRPVDSFDPSDGERTRYFVSRDQGRSFAPLAQFPIRDVQFSEHMAIERRDGSLLTLARASYGIAQARSHDGGKTWADDRPFVSNKGVNTRFFVRRLASGSWLLVLNDDPKSRANLTALLSENEGQTWPHKLVLDERRTVSYPDGVEGTDGFVYVAYDRGRYSKDEQEILFAKFTEADVRAGKLVDSSSRLKQTINRLADFGGGVHETREPQLMREALEKPPAAP